MNCHDISLMLDNRDVRLLGAAESQAVESHLQGCAECASDWQTHLRVLGTRVPEMAGDLPGRVWPFVESATPTNKSGLRSRRSLVWGCLLFAGAAAAMLGWQSLHESGLKSDWMAIPVAIESDAGRTSTRNVVPAPQPLVPATTGAPSPLQSAANPNPAAAAAVRPARHRLVVLPPRQENTDPAAVEFFNVAYSVILRDLRSKADLEVVEATAREVEMAEADVPPSPPPPPPPSPPPQMPSLPAGALKYGIGLPPTAPSNDLERDLAIARHLGGQYTLLVSLTVNSSGFWSIDTRYRGSSDDGGRSYSGDTGYPMIRQTDDPRSLGATIAKRVYAALYPDSALSQYVSALTDQRETETRRLAALSEALSPLRSVMQRNEASAGLADAVLQGAFELARSSKTETRRGVWELLRGISHPAALEALKLALLSDPEVQVRREAANSLFDSVSGAAVRAAFESAATSDPSPVVRLLAKLALMPVGERSTFIIATLHDSSLPPDARMAPLMLVRRHPSYVTDLSLDERALSAIADLAASSSDAAIKAAARAEVARAARAR